MMFKILPAAKVYAFGRGRTYRSIGMMIQRAGELGGRVMYIVGNIDSMRYCMDATGQILTSCCPSVTFKVNYAHQTIENEGFTIEFMTWEMFVDGRAMASFARGQASKRIFVDHAITEV